MRTSARICMKRICSACANQMDEVAAVPVLTNRDLFRRVTKRRVDKTKKLCVFCIEGFSYKQILKILPCQHYFHYQCLKPWFEKQTNCPMCRIDVKKYFEDEESL